MSGDTSYDVLVIGSGAGGAAAAHRLALDGHRVLLLEKGGELPADGATLDVRRVVHDGEFLSREPWQDREGRAIAPEEHFNVGGKTRWYGAAVLRFARHEFDADPAHGCPGWPLGYDDLAADYERAERILGVRTFPAEPDLASVVARLGAAGRGSWTAEPLPMALADGILADPREASHFDGFASVAGLKADAESAFIAPLRGLPNFRLETRADVVRLLGERRLRSRVTGVRLADGREFRAPATVLAAGALHSPRLLQRFVDEYGLAADLPCAPLVGRHLKLHLLTALVAFSPGRKRDLLRKTVLLTNAALPHSSVQPLGFDGELIGTLIPSFVPRVLAGALGERAYGFFLQTEDGSAYDNRVAEVAGEGGPQRLLDYDERRTPAARREHRDLIRSFRRALWRAGFASAARRVGVVGTAHACGTLMAGRDPRRSVVDADGRVHGLDGLWVADGSVLPRSSRVNPSLTIFAWGLRIAARLGQTLVAGRSTGASPPRSVSGVQA